MQNNIFINKDEVMRYLGYSNQRVEDSFYTLIDKVIGEVKENLNISFVYKIDRLTMEDGILKLAEDGMCIKSQELCKHLQACQRCVIMAITIGHSIDRKISYYEKFDVTKAMVFNACANVAVETAADNLCGDIEETLEGYHLTSRFSPGYGDFSLDYQKEILELLGSIRKAGISVSSGNMLMPCKSVTAIAGITKEVAVNNYNKCDNCLNRKKCQFRRACDQCGSKREA